MKQNISPATAAIIAIVVVAVIALVGYKYVLGGGSKGATSASNEARMKQNMTDYAANQRAEEAKHRGAGMPNMGGNPMPPGR